MAEAVAEKPQPTRPVSQVMAVCGAVLQSTERGETPKPPIGVRETSEARVPFRGIETESPIRERKSHVRHRRDRARNRRRFGDRLPIGISRSSHFPDYECDCELSYNDSVEYNLSSSDKENVKPSRKIVLDDALFEFFRKEAVKSLKNNFSKFCHHPDVWTKSTRFSGHVIGRDHFICYSIKYFSEVLNSLANRRKEVIRNFGFGCLLSFEKCEVPSAFVRWIASCVDTVSSQIIVDDYKVYYLDSLDFGARILDQSVPRISIWKGNLIKFFSDLDYKKNNMYGKRHLKKNLAHWYKEFGDVGDCKSENDASARDHESCFSGGFQLSLHKRFGSSLEAKIIDGIVESIQSAQLAKLQPTEKCELMTINVLNVLMVSKCCDVKAPTEHTNILGRDKQSSDHAITESDIASKLDLISPNVFLKVSSSSKVGNSFLLNPATPDFVSSRAAELGTFNTAHVIQPMVKVRSRLAQPSHEGAVLPLSKTYPAGVKDSRPSLYISSPISRINFSPISNEKDPNAPSISQVGSVSNQEIGRNFNVAGSKGAPIPVANSSPKLQLIVEPPVVHITGTSSFSFRQAELAKKGDDLYNSMANKFVMQGIKSDNDKSEDIFIDLCQGAFEDRIAKDKLVILQPKNSLVLPFVQSGRFPVSDIDIKNFCAIVDLAYTQGIQKTYAVKYPKVHCSYISLGQSLMV